MFDWIVGYLFSFLIFLAICQGHTGAALVCTVVMGLPFAFVGACVIFWLRGWSQVH